MAVPSLEEFGVGEVGRGRAGIKYTPHSMLKGMRTFQVHAIPA